MGNAEATGLLATQMARFRNRSYEDLVAMVEGPKHTAEVVGPSGSSYNVDVLVAWDGEQGGDVRVIGTIDGGGLRAFAPMSDDFIKAPDGSFRGKDS